MMEMQDGITVADVWPDLGHIIPSRLTAVVVVLVGHSHDSFHVLLKQHREVGGETESIPWGSPKYS